MKRFTIRSQHWQKIWYLPEKDIEREFGIPIVNKRISVTPIALVGGAACKTTEDFVTIAKTLDRAAKTVGVNFIGGYSALVSKGMTPAEKLLIRFDSAGYWRRQNVSAVL